MLVEGYTEFLFFVDFETGYNIIEVIGEETGGIFIKSYFSSLFIIVLEKS